MLSADPKSSPLIPMSDAERVHFEQIVPADHFLRRLVTVLDFEIFRPQLTAAYSVDLGRPPLDPVVLLKLETAARHYRLSDREVLVEARLNIAYRLFLGLSWNSPLPHPSTLCYFRGRLGTERMQQIFDTLVGQTRRLGLVRDRLRLKDATHLIANIAVPSTIRLVAEVRDRLLEALHPFAADQVHAEHQRAEVIRQATEHAKDEEQLAQRVGHLQSVVAWAETVAGTPAFSQADAPRQERLRTALQLVHKILADRAEGAQDKLLSLVDPDARCGKHGEYFDGYLLDVAMDADSEIITALNVLPGNGDEGGDAAHLIGHEEQAQGNDVEGISLDGAGFRGPVLQELTDPQGLDLEVFTPPTTPAPSSGFAAERFSLDVLSNTLSCPAGQTTQQRERNANDTGWKYRFSKKQCGSCPLRGECLVNANAKSRTVIKNEYEAEYAQARAQAQTPEYAEVRKQHPAIERKLAELVRRHDLRRARYWGQAKVLYQGLLTGLVVNLKRMVRLLFVSPRSGETVRAVVAAGS